MRASGDVTEPEPLDLEAFVSRRGDWLGRCAYLLTGNHDSALDLVQDTLLRAWRHQERVAKAQDIDRYVLRIMLNIHRSAAGRRRLPTTPLVEDVSLPDQTPVLDDADALAKALPTLKPRQRAVVVLRYWADYDDTEIAEVLQCRRSTVRSLAARGLAALRQHLEAP